MTAGVQPPSQALWLATLTTSHLDMSGRKSILLLACLMHLQVAGSSTTLTAEDLKEQEKEAKSIGHQSRWTLSNASRHR